MIRTEKTREELLAELKAMRQRIAELEDANTRQGERALQESERKFRKVYENAPFGMIICELCRDIHGKAIDFMHLQANPATADQTGFRLQDLVEKKASEIVKQDVLSELTALYGEVVATQIPTHYEQYFAIYDRTLSVTAFHLSENLFILLFVDISERKRAEQAIHDLNLELEQRVEQRTAQLATANTELQEFAYIVSHDLKAPLRAIAHLSSWVKEDYEGILDDRGKQYLALMKERVQHLDALIDGILEYSRIGRVEQQHEVIDVAELVQQVITSLSPPSSLDIRLHTMPSALHGNRIRLTQIFQNLIGNAIQYIDKADGVISITCQEHELEWQFAVQDNGPGIDSQFHQTIFTIFQTIHPGAHPESTGIGLTVVKKIVEVSGGKIWVESEHGKGATFYFTLPKSMKGRETN